MSEEVLTGCSILNDGTAAQPRMPVSQPSISALNSAAAWRTKASKLPREPVLLAAVPLLVLASAQPIRV